MDEEWNEWLEKAENDLKASKDSFNSSNYDWSCFQSQQSIEKALKAMYLKKYKTLLKTHDLFLLAKKIDAPEHILILCSRINPSYTDSRYPDLSRVYTREDASNVLKYAEEVLEWIKKNL